MKPLTKKQLKAFARLWIANSALAADPFIFEGCVSEEQGEIILQAMVDYCHKIIGKDPELGGAESILKYVRENY